MSRERNAIHGRGAPPLALVCHSWRFLLLFNRLELAQNLLIVRLLIQLFFLNSYGVVWTENI